MNLQHHFQQQFQHLHLHGQNNTNSTVHTNTSNNTNTNHNTNNTNNNNNNSSSSSSSSSSNHNSNAISNNATLLGPSLPNLPGFLGFSTLQQHLSIQQQPQQQQQQVSTTAKEIDATVLSAMRQLTTENHESFSAGSVSLSSSSRQPQMSQFSPLFGQDYFLPNKSHISTSMTAGSSGNNTASGITLPSPASIPSATFQTVSNADPTTSSLINLRENFVESFLICQTYEDVINLQSSLTKQLESLKNDVHCLAKNRQNQLVYSPLKNKTHQPQQMSPKRHSQSPPQFQRLDDMGTSSTSSQRTRADSSPSVDSRTSLKRIRSIESGIHVKRTLELDDNGKDALDALISLQRDKIGVHGRNAHSHSPSVQHNSSHNNSSDMEEASDNEESISGAQPRRWTADEDAALREAVAKYDGKNWKLIASEVPTRTHVQCLQRWRKALDPEVIKGHWSSHEDKLLLSLVAENPKNWGVVAAGIKGRTAKQCRERYYNHLDPNLLHSPWTPEEDEMILEYQKRMGNRWSEIAKLLTGRAESQVKVRFKSLTRHMERQNKIALAYDSIAS